MGLPYPIRVALWTMIAAGLLSPCVAGADSEGASFKLPLSSSDVVLEYSVQGRQTSTTRIYGDGRMVRSRAGVGIEARTEEVTRLDLVEIEALVRIAVDGGLFEAKQDDLRRRDSVGMPHASPTTLAIDLADYKGEGPARFHLKTEAPMYVARFNKDNPYLVAFGAIEEQILLIQLKAQAEAQSHAH